MDNIQLTKRLGAVAGLVKNGSRTVDVGTDHGFVPIYLYSKGISSHVIAMDINEGPLERARMHVEEYGFSEGIELRLSDGLLALLPGEADTMICAGMGGLLMMRIIEEGDPVSKGIRQMILQPQSDLCAFREFLCLNGFVTEREREIKEDGKFYTIMQVSTDPSKAKDVYPKAVDLICGSADCDKDRALKICHRFGPSLIYERDEVLHEYLLHELSVCDAILLKLSENEHADRMRDIMGKKNDISTVLELY